MSCPYLRDKKCSLGLAFPCWNNQYFQNCLKYLKSLEPKIQLKMKWDSENKKMAWAHEIEDVDYNIWDW